MKKFILFITILLFFTLIYFKTSINTSAETATDESNVLEKVKEKVESIRQNPKAYIGSVTDKTSDTLQIKNLDGKIDSISVSDNTTFKNTTKPGVEIKFTDIALGDYVAAMGTGDISNHLEARKIFIVAPVVEPERKIIFGSIKSLNKKYFDIEDSDKTTMQIFLPKSWKGPDVKDLEVGMQVVTVSAESEGKLTLRTIQKVTIE